MHWFVLAGASIVLVLSALLQMDGQQTVVLPVINQPLPASCMVHRWTGLDCPGCGLTRSFIHLAHGRPCLAWNMHPAGWVLFLFVGAQIPYRLFQLGRIRGGRQELDLTRYHWCVWLSVATLFAQWTYKMIAWVL